jgi:hypothetical protein
MQHKMLFLLSCYVSNYFLHTFSPYRPGLLPFSSNATQETTKKPVKVSIKATLDPEESPSPSPIPQKSSPSPSPSSSTTEKEVKSDTPSSKSSDTTPSTTTSSAKTTKPEENSDYNEEDYEEEDYEEEEEAKEEEDYNNDDYTENKDAEEEEEEQAEDDTDDTENPSMSPNMALALSKQIVMNNNLTDPKLRATLFALSKCRKYECIKKAHHEIAGRTRFNFPHFFLIGWQKCATTSVNSHLKSHPQFLPSDTKESHFFTVCQSSPTNHFCRAPTLRNYLLYFLKIQDAALGGLEKVTIDASVDYAWKGRSLAKDLHDLFPWLKIVMMMREPISRMISYTRMFTIKEIKGKGCMPPKTIYGCLSKGLNRESAVYANALEAWLDVFPADQIHVIQFEELQEDDQKVLHNLKDFLGMDTTLPLQEDLRNVNSRRSEGGYPLTLEEYQSLIALVRPAAERVAKMLGDKGIKNEKEWMGRWESVWNRVIEESCDADGQCEVNSNR